MGDLQRKKIFSPYSTPATNLQNPYKTITITSNLPLHLSTPSTDPTLMLISPHPQRLAGGLEARPQRFTLRNVQGAARKDIIPRVRGAKANRGPRPLPLSSASRGVWGGRARPCANLRQPRSSRCPPQPQAEPSPRDSRSCVHAHRLDTGSPRRLQSHLRRPSSGRCRALLGDTHPAAAAPCVPLPRLLARRLLPRGGPGWRRFPARPPSGAPCTGPGSGERSRSRSRSRRRYRRRCCRCRRCRRRPLSFPPSSLSASLPPRPASYFLDPVSARARQENRQLQDSCRAPSLARHKDGAAGDRRRQCRETSPPHPLETRGRGPRGKVVN